MSKSMSRALAKLDLSISTYLREDWINSNMYLYYIIFFLMHFIFPEMC